MTAPRLARAGRSRFLICIGILIIMVSFVAIFHNSQTQLDESRQVGLRCEQQLEALTAQMQVVVNSKLRLEKTIASERLMNEQSKQEIELKVKEKKEQGDKELDERNNRISSLQQIFNLLQTQHDDLKTDCGKVKASNMETINSLMRKVKSLQSLVDQGQREREKDVEHWKVKYKQMESEKLEADTKVFKYEEIIGEYKLNCKYHPTGAHDLNKKHTEGKSPAAVEKSFDAQLPVSENLYKIAIKKINSSDSFLSKTKQSINSRMHNYNNGDGHEALLLTQNQSNPKGGGTGTGGIIINSVENFQMIPKQLNSAADSKNSNDMNVLQEPPQMQMKSSTASTGTRKTSDIENKMLAPIAAIPTVTPQSKISSTSVKIAKLKLQRPLPIGVVPIQRIPNDFAKNDETVVIAPHDQHKHIESNRYLNLIDEESQKKDGSLLSKRDNFQNDNEGENGAHEINDNNDFNIDDTKNHHEHHLLHEVVPEEEKMNNVNNPIVNNAAEEDTNIYDKNENDVDVEIINKRGQNIGNGKYLAGNEKLINEIVGDHGKAEYPDDMREDLHMEEQAEDEDDDEYGNPGARNQDVAVRN